MSFLLPGAAACGLVAGLIVLLYLLKARRPPVTVSSTLLWRRALAETRATLPWQRLRPNLLLVLQLLAVLLFTLALMRPYVLRAGAPRQDVVLVLDASLTTQTLDAGGSRFQAEVGWATALIHELPAGQTVSILRLDANPSVIIAASADPQSLVAALASQQPGYEQPDVQTAASIALGLAAQDQAGGNAARIVVLRSIATPPLPFPPGSEAQDHTFGEARTWDAGIDRLGTARAPDGTITVAADLFNTDSHPHILDVYVYADDNLGDVQSVSLPPEGTASMQSPGLPAVTRAIHVQLAGTDALAADDQAWTVINSTRTGHVLLVSAENIFLATALRAMPGITVRQIAPTAYTPAQAAQADLTIFDRYLPRALPSSNLLLVDPPAGLEGIGVGPARSGSTPSPGDDPASLLRYTHPEQWHIARTGSLEPAAWTDVALRDRQGPLMLEGTAPLGNRVAVVGFDLHASDLPLSADFPVFVANLVQWAVPPTIVSQTEIQPGRPLLLTVPAGTTRLTVVQPDGKQEPVSLNDALTRPGSVPFTDTQTPGIYHVVLDVAGKAVNSAFAVNAGLAYPSLMPQSPAPTVPASHGPAAKPGTVPEDLTGGVVVLVLGVLSIEWYLAMRRQ
jgi:hypothetical protein